MRKPKADIEFLSGTGRKVKLVFQKSEYRAYIYDEKFRKWDDMKLGGLDEKVLIDYISKKF